MQTLPWLFEQSVERFSSNVLMWEHDGSAYKPSTYSQIQGRVHQFAAGLLAMGVKHGDRIALLSEGRRDWLVSELGVLYTGAINVPLMERLVERSELRFRLDHAGCRMVIVSGRQLSKVREIAAELESIETLIILDNTGDLQGKEILFSTVVDKGTQFLNSADGRDRFEKIWRAVADNDLANICYTSGTTAQPKGIMLTHRNYTANVEQANTIMFVPQTYVSLIILPWDHSFAHTAGLYTLITNGAAIAAVQQGKSPIETLKNIPANIRAIRPTFLLSVPALAKSLKKNIEKGINEKGSLIKTLFRIAIKNAYALNRDGWSKGFQPQRRLLNSLFDRILFKKIRQSLGGRIEFFIGGGALLDIELQKFFYAIGMPMFQGYGLTEASPIISSSSPQKHKLGSSGFLVKYLDLKICDEQGAELSVGVKGEIVVRGENVMAGYWKNEEATRETIKDGWLYTGDLGYMDKDGFLYVLGRSKSLLIANDGEKYSPEGIEEAITDHSRLIDQCILHNNQNPYTIALIVPNPEAVKQAITSTGLDPGSDQAAEQAILLIKKELDAYLTGGHYAELFPDRWIPSAFAVLDQAFTPDNHLVNSTGKIVRPKVIEAYGRRIDLLYTAEGKQPLHSSNHASMKSILKS